MIQNFLPYIYMIIIVISSLLCFCLFYKLLTETPKKREINKNEKRGQKTSELTKQLNRRLKNSRYKYSKKIKWLSQKGVMYAFKDYKLSVMKYNIIRFIVASCINLVYVLLFTPNLIVMLIIQITGFFATDLYFLYKNRCDNKNIFSDIYKIYLIMSLNLNSNVFIVETIVKCSENIENRRLKRELLELSQNLSSKLYSVEEALEKFKNRFDNKDISNLIILLKNYYLFGTNDNYIGDLMTNLVTVSKARAIEEQEDIENKGQMYLLLFFALIVAAIAYVLGMMVVTMTP